MRRRPIKRIRGIVRMHRAAAAAMPLGIVVLTLAAPQARAAMSIDVAPSANGLVMAGVPTSIAATGFAGIAKAYRFDDRSAKWIPMGTVSSGRAMSFTFPKVGRVKVKLVPRDGPARTFVVPVYGRFVPTTDPTTFGDVTLPNGRPISAFDAPNAVPASAGCALVDVGLVVAPASGQSASATLVVQSTGAPSVRLPVTDGSATLLAVPVKGDAQVSIVDSVTADPSGSKAGVVWYCLTARMPQAPS